MLYGIFVLFFDCITYIIKSACQNERKIYFFNKTHRLFENCKYFYFNMKNTYCSYVCYKTFNKWSPQLC